MIKDLNNSVQDECLAWTRDVQQKIIKPLNSSAKSRPGYLLWDIVFKCTPQHVVGQVYAISPEDAQQKYFNIIASRYMRLATRLMKLQNHTKLVAVKPKSLINQWSSEAVKLRREIIKMNSRINELTGKIRAYD